MDNNIIEYTEKAIHRQMAVTGKSAKRRRTYEIWLERIPSMPKIEALKSH